MGFLHVFQQVALPMSLPNALCRIRMAREDVGMGSVCAE